MTNKYEHSGMFLSEKKKDKIRQARHESFSGMKAKPKNKALQHMKEVRNRISKAQKFGNDVD